MSFSATSLRSFCVRKLSPKRNAEVCNKVLVAMNIGFRFISLEALFGGFKNFLVSPGFQMLRRCSNLEVRHADLRKCLVSVFLKEYIRCSLREVDGSGRKNI